MPTTLIDTPTVTEKAIGQSAPKAFRFTEDLGVGGVAQYGGVLQDEFLRELRGDRWVKTVREMIATDEIIGGILYGLDAIVRKAKWDVQAATVQDGAEVQAEDQERADFLRQALFDDLDVTWSDTVAEWLTFFPHGWAVAEMTFKRRSGFQPPDGTVASSLFDDGRIGWKRIALRGQETLARWEFNATGDVLAMVQRHPTTAIETSIPMAKCLHFRLRPQRGSPEGSSPLRPVYRSYFTKKRLLAFEAIGIERDLAGYPTLQLQEGAPDLWNTNDANAQTTLAALKKFIKSVRRDDQEGAIIPPWAEFKLLSTGARRAFDTSAIITRFDQRIAMALLWDIMLLGHEKIGTQALAESKLELLAASIDGLLDTIMAVVNRFAVPLLFRLNGENPEMLPRLTHDPVKSADLGKLADYVEKLTRAGAMVPDEEMSRYLARQASLPVGEESIIDRSGGGPEPEPEPTPEPEIEE